MFPPDAADRLLQAAAMSDLGVDLMRQNLRRRHPEAADDEIGDLLQAWRCPPADHPGTVRSDFT